MKIGYRFSQFLYNVCRRLISFFPNESLYLRAIFYLKMGYKLNLKNPRTYSEKLQWLKLYNRKPEYVKMVDKRSAKEYVGERIGYDYIVPTLGVWKTPEEIDWDRLPQQFVLKTSHGGGSYGVFICHDKQTVNKQQITKGLRKALKQNIAKYSCEWVYGQISPCIIAEKLLVDSRKSSLDDYKIMCFNGVAKLIEYHQGRYSNQHTQDFYDRNWERTSFSQGSYGQISRNVVPRPVLLNKMLELSEMLSKDIPHVRVDWYIVEGKLYFGEMTFFDGSGLVPWDNFEDDLLLGSWITLTNNKCQG